VGRSAQLVLQAAGPLVDTGVVHDVDSSALDGDTPTAPGGGRAPSRRAPRATGFLPRRGVIVADAPAEVAEEPLEVELDAPMAPPVQVEASVETPAVATPPPALPAVESPAPPPPAPPPAEGPVSGVIPVLRSPISGPVTMSPSGGTVPLATLAPPAPNGNGSATAASGQVPVVTVTPSGAVPVIDPPATTLTGGTSTVAAAPVVVPAPAVPRPSAAPATAPHLPPRLADAHARAPGTSKPMSSTRRRRRGPVIIGWLVVVALLVAGAVVARQFFFAPSWTDETAPLAAFVESQRSLTFDHPVTVTTLDGPTFAARAYDVLVGVDADDEASTAAGARALGLLQGDLESVPTSQLAGAGRIALYDPGSGTIYVDTTVAETDRRAALVRELDLALLDQRFGWGDRLEGLTSAQRLAFLTALVGDAELTGRGWSASSAAGTGSGSPSPLPELSVLADATATPAPMALLVTTPSAAGALLAGNARADGGVTPDVLASDVPESDLGLVDAAATVGTAPEAAEDATGDSLGALTWFAVLAGRIDTAQAWAAVAAWADDTTEVFQEGEQVCVRSEIVTRAGADSLLLAASLQQWAQAGPAEAGATVEVDGDGVITVLSCDPGSGAATLTRPAVAATAVAYVVFEQLLLQEAAAASGESPGALAPCLVPKLRDAGTVDELVGAAGLVGWNLAAVDSTAARTRTAELAATCTNG
jgi:hypothetical protein